MGQGAEEKGKWDRSLQCGFLGSNGRGRVSRLRNGWCEQLQQLWGSGAAPGGLVPGLGDRRGAALGVRAPRGRGWGAGSGSAGLCLKGASRTSHSPPLELGSPRGRAPPGSTAPDHSIRNRQQKSRLTHQPGQLSPGPPRGGARLHPRGQLLPPQQPFSDFQVPSCQGGLTARPHEYRRPSPPSRSPGISPGCFWQKQEPVAGQGSSEPQFLPSICNKFPLLSEVLQRRQDDPRVVGSQTHTRHSVSEGNVFIFPNSPIHLGAHPVRWRKKDPETTPRWQAWLDPSA